MFNLKKLKKIDFYFLNFIIIFKFFCLFLLFFIQYFDCSLFLNKNFEKKNVFSKKYFLFKKNISKQYLFKVKEQFFYQNKNIKISAKSWISIDVNSGQILSSYLPNLSIEPASLTKIMTAYVVFKSLKEENLKLEQRIIISEKAWRTVGSRMFVEPGKLATIHELNQGMIIQSGNDASVALSEAISIHESSFVYLMNKEAKRLKMEKTFFINSTGLPDKNHKSSVLDLANLSRNLIREFPQFFHYYSQKKYKYNGINQINRNNLLFIDNSIDGMKTGYTSSAGYCLIATAKKGDRRILTVIVGSDSEFLRSKESLKLIKWSFENFESINLKTKESCLINSMVWNGNKSFINLIFPKNVYLSIPKSYLNYMKLNIYFDNPIIAPIFEGQKIFKFFITLNGSVLLEDYFIINDNIMKKNNLKIIFKK